MSAEAPAAHTGSSPPMNHRSHVKLLEIAGEVAEWLKAAVC